jgi:hypothetical protein
MDLFVNPELQFVRAAQNEANRYETYEFAIRVRLDNTGDEENGEAGQGLAGVN